MRDPVKKREANRRYYFKSKQAIYTQAGERRRTVRLELIEKLGGKCEICGERDPIVLDFDHIENNGRAHRREHGNRSVFLVKKCLDLYQLLCKNCNWRKEYWRRMDAKFKRKATQADGSSCA
jgi:hypothetical protein